MGNEVHVLHGKSCCARELSISSDGVFPKSNKDKCWSWPAWKFLDICEFNGIFSDTKEELSQNKLNWVEEILAKLNQKEVFIKRTKNIKIKSCSFWVWKIYMSPAKMLLKISTNPDTENTDNRHFLPVLDNTSWFNVSSAKSHVISWVSFGTVNGSGLA